MSVESSKRNPANNQADDWFEEETAEISFDRESLDTGEEKIISVEEAPEVVSGGRRDPSWQWSIGIACVILGIIIALLFKAYRKGGEGSFVSPWDSRKDLAVMVKYLQTDRNRLQTDLEKARKTIQKYEENSSRGMQDMTMVKTRLEKYRQEAGISPVHGPGITVQMGDSPIKPGDGDDPNFYIVHDVDLLALVNELWASGAEAISINDQRVVINTPIRCVGPTITVNTVRLTPPYVVKAIGPPANLETGLRYTGGFLDSMTPNIERGVEIKVKKVKDIVIPGFRGSLINRYAKPYTETK